MQTGLGRRRGKSYHLFWIGVFFTLLFGTMGSLYWATQQVDYIWRWNRIPQYFFYEDEREIRSDVDGDVKDIKAAGKDSVVVVKSVDGDIVEYKIPGGEARVTPRSMVSTGDTLGVEKQWKMGLLTEGMWMTLEISFISIIFGILLGLFTGLARISPNPCLRWSAITYIELVRGSPLLVQIFIWYFVMGTLINNLLRAYGIPEVPTLWFGVASLAFFCGAYVAEIVRAGIQSIHRGQAEAARSLGMTTAQAMRHVILPQAFRRILPPLAGQFISLIKDSSLLGIIAIRELTKATREVVTTSLQPFEFWFVCALLYLLITFGLSLFTQYLERRSVS